MTAVRCLRLALVCASIAWFAAPLDAQTLRGSRASVDRIYRQALNHNLTFYDNPAAIRRAIANGELVRLEGNRDYRLHNVSYPYLLPPAHLFVERLAGQYRAACGERMVVTSATRPRSMRLVNSSPRSVHPAGMAVDLRRPANPRCLSWLRRTLLSLEAGGVIEAVEERNPPHFHVAVFPDPYRRYVLRRGGPAGAATSVSARPAAAQPAVVRYRVRRGDSLWSIARRHGRTVQDLQQANDIRGTRIVVDQVLVIPTAR